MEPPDNPDDWKHVFPSKAELADELLTVWARAQQQLDWERGTEEGRQARRDRKMASWKTRLPSGLRRGPQTAGEWRRYHELGLNTTGRMRMDLGDIATQLGGIRSELSEVQGEVAGVQEATDQHAAQVEAARQRVETAIGTLHATAGNHWPDGLKNALDNLTVAENRAGRAVDRLREAAEQVQEAYTAVHDADQFIADYIELLFNS